jgi:hypothetical protein
MRTYDAVLTMLDVYVQNSLNMNRFHEALTGKAHACWLKPRIGKASIIVTLQERWFGAADDSA